MVNRALRIARRLVPVAFVLLFSTTAGSRVPSPVPPNVFELVGYQPTRGYFSLQNFDRVDLVNGSLAFTFADFALPGNAGMNIGISRTYSHQATDEKWAFSFVGVPIMVKTPTLVPLLVMGDGSEKRLSTGSVAGCWITEDFWCYNSGARTLSLPNGWVAEYEIGGPKDGMLKWVEDRFGNRITPNWISGTTFPLLPQTVVQTVSDAGATRTRTLQFVYEGANPRLPSSVSDGSHDLPPIIRHA